MSSMKSKKTTLEDESPRSECVQYATGEKWGAITNSFRKIEVAESKQKRCSDVDVCGGEGKVQCYKEQYWTGTWNIKFMDQCKLDVVKQEMARVNINIFEISEL